MPKKVTATGKDNDGDIIRLCGEWGSVSKHQAKAEISNNLFAYESGGARVEVVNDETVTDGFYLRTVPDSTGKNNLDDLPDC